MQLVLFAHCEIRQWLNHGEMPGLTRGEIGVVGLAGSLRGVVSWALVIQAVPPGRESALVLDGIFQKQCTPFSGDLEVITSKYEVIVKTLWHAGYGSDAK